ncbi:hypothetical protein V492_03941, partial [Pseudogymnoascus sp. VKM F-4246]
MTLTNPFILKPQPQRRALRRLIQIITLPHHAPIAQPKRMRHQQQIRLRRRRRPLQRRRVYHVPDLQAAVRGVDLNERHHAHWDALAAAAILGIGADDKVLLGVPSGIEEPVHRVHE